MPSCTQNPHIKKLMDAHQYEKSGLNKLNATELRNLNAWLAQYAEYLCHAMAIGRHAIQPTVAATSPGKTGTKAETGPIVSHIAGEFHGWTGNTRFALTNGQVWVQAGPGYYKTRIKRPKVVIRKLLIGYILQVDGKEVFVRRVH